MEEPRRPVSPLIIIIALGMIAALLYPFFQVFMATERSRRLTAQGFGFVVVAMALLALYNIARIWLFPPPRE